jgi:hypothetical protein
MTGAAGFGEIASAVLFDKRHCLLEVVGEGRIVVVVLADVKGGHIWLSPDVPRNRRAGHVRSARVFQISTCSAKRIVYKAEIPDSAFDLRVPEQELHGSQIAVIDEASRSRACADARKVKEISSKDRANGKVFRRRRDNNCTKTERFRAPA